MSQGEGLGLNLAGVLQQGIQTRGKLVEKCLPFVVWFLVVQSEGADESRLSTLYSNLDAGQAAARLQQANDAVLRWRGNDEANPRVLRSVVDAT